MYCTIYYHSQSNPNTPLSSSHGYALSIHEEQGRERKKNGKKKCFPYVWFYDEKYN